MKDIHTSEMIQMEKIIIAVNEKGYSRYPHQRYPIFNEYDPDKSLIAFVIQEYHELIEAIDNLQIVLVAKERISDEGLQQLVYKARLEVADVKNTVNYLDEALLRAYIELERAK